MTDYDDRSTDIRVRPSVAESYSRYVDRIGRSHLHKIPVTTFLQMLPASAMTAIPGEFWNTDMNDEGFTEAVISCPCKETPRVEVGRMLSCACDRTFFYTGTDVYVGNSPVASSANQETPAES